MSENYVLTDEHRAQMKPWADRWLANAMSTKAMDDVDREAMRVAVRGLYEAAGKKPPSRVVFAPSPLVAVVAGGFAAGILRRRQTLGANTEPGTQVSSKPETVSSTRITGLSRIRDAVANCVRDSALDDTTKAVSGRTVVSVSSLTNIGLRVLSAVDNAVRGATDDVPKSSDGSTSDWVGNFDDAARGYAYPYLHDLDATSNITRIYTIGATLKQVRSVTGYDPLDRNSPVRTIVTNSDVSVADVTWHPTWSAIREATDSIIYDDVTAGVTSSVQDPIHRLDVSTIANVVAADDIRGGLERWYVFNEDVRAVARSLGDEEYLMRFAKQAWRMMQAGNHAPGWVAFISFFDHVAKLNLPIYEKYRHWENASIHGSWRVMHEDFCIVSDRPELLTMDDSNRPHNADGPFCRWRDGSALYSWHGVRIPAWCIEQKHLITKERISAETNTEVRRAMCEIIGWERVMEMFEAVVLHRDECLGLPRVLFEADVDGVKARFIQVTNGTVENGVRRKFIEGVPNTVNTCHEAVAWQCGVPVSVHSEAVRT